jgi:thiamine monophosphate synthase
MHPLQYRNKSGNARVMLEQARVGKKRMGSFVRLIMNDRADLCLWQDSTAFTWGRRICRLRP